MVCKKLPLFLIGLLVSLALSGCSGKAASAGNAQNTSSTPAAANGSESNSSAENSNAETDEQTLPENLVSIQEQMLKDLVDKNNAYTPSEVDSEYLNYYRGVITEIISLDDKNGFITVQQLEGGMDYGTPLYTGYGRYKVYNELFEVGDYVEILYNASHTSHPEAYHGSCFPMQQLTRLVSRQLIDSKQGIYTTATVKEVSRDDRFYFTFEFSDGSTFSVKSDMLNVLENMWEHGVSWEGTGVVPGDTVDIWGYYSTPELFNLMHVVKIPK